MNFRKLKISYFVRNRKAEPKIILSGTWLKDAGFEVGQDVNIEVKDNQLIIRNAN
ncbi:SymE family type I addiction module toxin [Chryseobacterium sp. MP_3.2]|uniref:SymE family type I addiction module toxin n=1 Tax=Chryseobacterium sp. MP_3.2 TaxID=3071712 RepID=UPI002E04F20C|nr:hypothetical protein [Chryseobacterium sp. MP_3.2]